jgi:hypothetical protein
MTHDEWLEKYAPVANNVTPGDSFGGKMFETFDKDLAFVKAQDPRCVWTLIDNNEGWQGITSGFHHVNRMGYFVSAVPFDGEYLEVTISDDSDYEFEPDDEYAQDNDQERTHGAPTGH